MRCYGGAHVALLVYLPFRALSRDGRLSVPLDHYHTTHSYHGMLYSLSILDCGKM